MSYPVLGLRLAVPVAIALIVAASATYAAAGNVPPDHQLTASDPANGDSFGYSVDISGRTAVVGSRQDDDGCTVPPDCDTGSAYVFEQQGDGSWLEVKKLKASDPGDDNWFGSALAIDGDTILVGADGSDIAGVDSGEAYVFQRNQGGVDNWGLVTELVGSGVGMDDRFGAHVAIDGDYVAVASAAGTFVFERNLGGPDNWGERTSVIGGSVALEGETMALGLANADDTCPPQTPDCNAGAVVVVGRDVGGTNNWGEITRLVAPDAAPGARFGWSVALSGDTLAVGAVFDPEAGFNAGAVYLFERDLGGPDNWGFAAKRTGSNTEESDWFGVAVALEENRLVVGARVGNCPGFTDTGAAYRFARNPGTTDTWTERETLCATLPEDGDFFGVAVRIASDLIIVGARQDDDNCDPPGPDCNTGSAFAFSLVIFEDGFESGDTSAWSLSSGAVLN